MTLLDWFKSIAFALNDKEPDHEFTRYPLDQMVEAYNAGLCLVHKYRPDLFTEWRIVKLSAGKYQDVRGCCENVLGVADQTDEDGNIIKEISDTLKTSTKTTRNWNKPSCISNANGPDGYVVNDVGMDANMNGRFTVSPPVPCDVEAYVRVKCVSGPCPVEVDELNGLSATPCDMLAALWYFVLARMQAGDRFTDITYSNMQYNHKMFFNILGIVEAKEKQIEVVEES